MPGKTTANNLHGHENKHELLLDDLGGFHFNVKTDSLLEDRYPTSSKSDSHIYVSDTDVKNHVYGISISKDRVRLSFEKHLDTGILAYPACKLVLDQLIELNERPTTVQEFFEEVVRSRRIIWRNETEEMLLFCFEKDGRYLVEAVSFYKS